MPTTGPRWRIHFGGMKAEDAKELKQLRLEDQRRKRMVADREFQIEMLQWVAPGKWRARHADGKPGSTWRSGSAAARGRCVGL